MVTNLTGNSTEVEAYSYGVYDIIQITFAALSFVLNAMFLLVLVMNRELVRQRRITYHVGNLALADTLSGLGQLLFYSALMTQTDSLIVIVLFDKISMIGYLMSFYSVFLMAIERAVVIRNPFTWRDKLPLKKILVLMLGAWITVVLFVAFSYLSKAKYTLMCMFRAYFLETKYALLSFYALVWSVCALVIASLTVLVNIHIFKKLQEEKEKAATISSNQQKSKRLTHKASILVLLLTVIMIVTCLPSLMCKVIFFSFWELGIPFSAKLLKIYSYFLIAESLNFFVNPIIYIWKVRVYQLAFCRTFKINK